MIKLEDINWQPTDRHLRRFGGISLVALPLLAWIWGGSGPLIGTCAGVGAVLAVIGAAAPQLLKPAYLALTVVAIPIGIVVGEIAMILTYFGVILPIGLFLRLIGKSTLDLKIDRSRASYWTPKSQPRDVSRYYHQS